MPSSNARFRSIRSSRVRGEDCKFAAKISGHTFRDRMSFVRAACSRRLANIWARARQSRGQRVRWHMACLMTVAITATRRQRCRVTTRSKGPRLSRRSVLKGAAALGGSAIGSSIGGFPTIWAQNIKDVVLRHAGPPVTAIPRIAEQATKDLGFTVQMQASEPADLLNRFLSQSSAIDCADVSFVYMRYLVGRDVLQAIPLAKVKHWDKTLPLFTRGQSTPTGARRRNRASRRRCILYATGAGWPEGDHGRRDRLGHRRADRSPMPTRSASGPTSSAARSRAGATCSMATSRARPRCRTIPPSASSTSPWRWRRAATSSTATKAT